MDQLIVWRSNTKLGCAGCGNPDVVVCVPQVFVAHPNTTYQPSYIMGRLVASVISRDSCSNTSYKYSIAYDDAQIAAGYTLTPNDITGVFCTGCISQWVTDQIALQAEVIAALEARVTALEGP